MSRKKLIELVNKEDRIHIRLFLLIMREFQHKAKEPDPLLEYVRKPPPTNFEDLFCEKLKEKSFQESVVDFDLVLNLHRIINNQRICYECEMIYEKQYFNIHSRQLLDILCKNDPMKRKKVDKFFYDLFDGNGNMEGFIFHALYFTLDDEEKRNRWIQLTNMKSFTPGPSQSSKLEVRDNFWWLKKNYGPDSDVLMNFNSNALVYLCDDKIFNLYFNLDSPKIDTTVPYNAHCIESIFINHKRVRDDISITYIENMEKIRTHKFKDCDRSILIMVSDANDPNKRKFAGAYIENKDKKISMFHNMESAPAINKEFEEYKDHVIDVHKVTDVETVLGFLESHVMNVKVEPTESNYIQIGKEFMKIVYSHPNLPVYSDKFTTHHKNSILKRSFYLFNLGY